MPSYSYNYALAEHADFSYSGSGTGVNRVGNPYNLAQEVNQHATVNKVGRHTEKGQPDRDRDGFYKFKLAPNLSQPVAPTVPLGSLVTAATWGGFVPGGHTSAQDVFFAGISRNASSNTIGPSSNWSHDNMTYSDLNQWCHSSQVYNGAVQVNETNASLGGVNYGTAWSMGFNAAKMRPAQRHLINVEATATFDRYRAVVAPDGSLGGTGDLAWEAWTERPTGYTIGAEEDLTWNAAGMFLGRTNYRDITTLGGNFYWDFPEPIILGAGPQFVVFVPVGTVDYMQFDLNYHSSTNHQFVRGIHPASGGSGFGIMPYISNRDFPSISGDQDDTLNGNQIGTVLATTIPILPPFSGYASPDISAIIQECIDEVGYDDEKNIAITLSHKHADTMIAAGWYFDTPFWQYLSVTWTPPPTIEYFTGEPLSIPRGAGAILKWEVTESDATSIDNGVGLVSLMDVALVYPTETTTYTLTAYSIAKTVTATVTITVTEPEGPSLFDPSETTIANAALTLLGERRIDSLNDGTVTANIIADRFNELRDALLRLIPWNFATSRASLSPNPETPVWGFGNAYTLPSDFVRLLEVDDDGMKMPYHIEGQNIVTSINPPLDITYTKRVVGAVEMDPLFRDCLAAFIAVELAEAITGGEVLKQVLVIFQERFMDAGMANGQEHEPLRVIATEWQSARGRHEER